MSLKSLSDTKADLEAKSPKISDGHPYFLLGQQVVFELLSILHHHHMLYLRPTYSKWGKVYIVKLRTQYIDRDHMDWDGSWLVDNNGDMRPEINRGYHTFLWSILRKTRIDELPSLCRHVCIKWDMSLVGWRPLVLGERKQVYADELEQYLSLKLAPWWIPIKRLWYRTGTAKEKLCSYIHEAETYAAIWKDPNSFGFFLWWIQRRIRQILE